MSNAHRPTRGRTYLDHNATTPLDPRVADAMHAAASVYGNPSSIHEEGRAARDLVESARRKVAVALGADPGEVLFTSGGTESDLLGIVGLYRLAAGSGRPGRILVPPIEHPAALGAARWLEEERGAEVRFLRVDGDGRLDPDEVAVAARDGAAILAIALANHELGTLQEVAALARVARDAGALVHCDAVQGFGKLPLRAARLGVDALAVSAHKASGPKGVGALWVRRGLDLGPLFPGGHQERGRRPGTESVLGAVGLGVAADLAVSEGIAAQPAVAALAAKLEEGVLDIPGARIHGSGAPRVPGTVNAGFAGAPGELVVQALDLHGIAASTGAACTSGVVEASPVLLALGLGSERAAEGVRLSLGRQSAAADIEALLEVLPAIVERVREFA
jgi:cysteine desulfurase